MVQVKQYPCPPVDRRAIGRYAGVARWDAFPEALSEECLQQALPRLSYRACREEFPVMLQGDLVDLSFVQVRSASLSQHLAACDRVVVFAATVGLSLDRLLSRYGRLSPATALLLDAIGTERVEGLCDAVCRELETEAAAQGRAITSRFSPGYGDLPLALQQDIFRVLQPHRYIGLTLNDSLLMSPSKSVTALVGLKRMEK